MKKRVIAGLTGLLMVFGAGSAMASLSTSYQFNGNGNWSLDAVGSNNTPVGDIQAVVPTGSTVVAAFLYSSMYTTSPVPAVNFAGTVYSGSDWTALGVNPDAGLAAYRTDVTAQVAAAIGGGAAVPFTFTVQSENPNTSIDGEVLAIVYSNPAETYRTIGFLDGFSASSGDTFQINLADPLTAADLADPSFEALFSLGIGFGYQDQSVLGQYSVVDVNGQRLTTSAGGQDDGGYFNGGLITVGGLGDDPLLNPADPNQTPTGDPRYDDELYSLYPFLSAGLSQIIIDTLNPSHDDNIFFAGINITAEGIVTAEPIPEPATMLLLGTGLVGVAGAARRRKKNQA